MNPWDTHDWVEEMVVGMPPDIRRVIRCKVCEIYGIEGSYMWSFDGKNFTYYGGDFDLITCKDMIIKGIIK